MGENRPACGASREKPEAAEFGSVELPKAACPSTTNSTLPGSGRLEREILLIMLVVDVKSTISP